jgi:protein-S-isoprenylcysteine O-methyltransferase Ste14
MAVAVLALEGVFAAAAIGLRTIVQWRRTGDTGWRLRRASSPTGRAVEVALPLVFGLAVAAPIADLLGLPRVAALDVDWVHAFGLALMAIGALLTVVAQFAMGASWRFGTDEQEHTVLVTDGVFAWVRNPIYSAMLVTLVGLVLALPNFIALVALGLAAVAIEVQVRWVEEPLLERGHGGEYRAWAARTGRFVPGIGRSSAPA